MFELAESILDIAGCAGISGTFFGSVCVIALVSNGSAIVLMGCRDTGLSNIDPPSASKSLLLGTIGGAERGSVNGSPPHMVSYTAGSCEPFNNTFAFSGSISL